MIVTSGIVSAKRQTNIIADQATCGYVIWQIWCYIILFCS